MATPTQSVFDIPELLAYICQYLTQHDMAQCMVASKNFARMFEPYLYQHFYHDGCLQFDSSGLIRNLHHLKTAEIHLETAEMCLSEKRNSITSIVHGLLEPEEWPVESEPQLPDTAALSNDSPICTNLKRLDLGHRLEYVEPWYYKCLFLLLHHNPGLTNLTVSGMILSHTHIFQEKGSLRRLFQESVIQLRHLHTLTIDDVFVLVGDFLGFLGVCLRHPTLTELYCQFVIYELASPSCAEDRPRLESILQEAVAAKTTNGTITNKITALQLPSSEQGYPELLLLPILKSELLDLKWFSIPLILDNYHDKLKAVLQKHCPNLKDLDAPPCQDPTEMGNAATNTAFFEACTGLVRFCSSEFEDQDCYANPRGIVRTLVKHQSETLEEIEFLECFAVFSKDLQAILSSCKRLRKLKIITPSYSSGTLEFEDIVTGEWVCRGLKSLWLVLASRLDRTGKDEMQEAVIKLAYGQIGRMLELETLILAVDHSDYRTNDPDSYYADLTLVKGWLGELTRLKRLRCFGVRDYFWSEIGQAEVEFMHEEWPKLDTIAFGVSPSLVADLPHWKWLKQKRPLLRYTHWDSLCE
ncbi:hypothetical protein BGZ50_000334 [Haplosporangium sp. Z 11]|nr:hypothetical protein BGZ50_000334 [Haplosporangium sp. Z 11]